jgi:hypothetical protein
MKIMQSNDSGHGVNIIGIIIWVFVVLWVVIWGFFMLLPAIANVTGFSIFWIWVMGFMLIGSIIISIILALNRG